MSKVGDYYLELEEAAGYMARVDVDVATEALLEIRDRCHWRKGQPVCREVLALVVADVARIAREALDHLKVSRNASSVEDRPGAETSADSNPAAAVAGDEQPQQ